MTPYDAWMQEFTRCWDRDPSIEEAIIIRGINVEGDQLGDEEADTSHTSRYTAEQMSQIRYVFLTEKRNDRLEEMRRFILGEQANQWFTMHGTEFSYEVLDGFSQYKSNIYNKLRNSADKFDSLFGYTYHLNEYDTWMHDNEGNMQEFMSSLARMWRRLLTESDQELGIDAEFTRPGVVQLLQQMKDKIENDRFGDQYTFNFE